MKQLPKEYSNVILSEGTMRTEDLIFNFSSFLNSHKTILGKDGIKKVDAILKRIEGLELILDSIGEKFSYQSINDAFEILWLEIAWLLNQIAPENCYFGSHVGDGCCYGFHSLDDLE